MKNKRIFSVIMKVIVFFMAFCSSVYGANFSIVSNFNADMNPAVAYNSTNDEYLVVYEYESSASNHDIYARRVSTGGSILGSFAIATSTVSEVKPKVAYNSNSNQYMVVWEYDGSATNHDIKAIIIDADGGTPIFFDVAAWPGTETTPDIAYNSTNNQYMVVWVGEAADNKDIYGRIFDASGNHISLPHISLESYDETSPSVTYNSSENNYLVLWHGKPPQTSPYIATYYTIYGSIVTSNGTLGAGVAFGTYGSNNRNPRSSWNPSGEYLVVMEEASSDGSVVAVKGQCLNGSAVKQGGIFEISGALSEHKYAYPDVAYNAYSNEYLVAYVYASSSTGFDIYCRQVSPGGAFPGSELLVSNLGYNESVPAVASGNLSTHLMAWQDDRGTSVEPDIYGSFAGRPIADTQDASDIGQNGATLSGVALTNGRNTTCYFEYGTTTAYGDETSHQSIGSGAGILPVNAYVSGLLPNQTYHFRIVAENDMGRWESPADRTFTTLDADPTIVTTDETNVGITSVTLNGAINPNGTETTYSFEYGETTNYGSWKPSTPQSAGSGRGLFGVFENLTGLLPNQTYHYRLVGFRGATHYPGSDQSFTTAPLAPTVSIQPPSDATANQVRFNGTVNPHGSTTSCRFYWGPDSSHLVSTRLLYPGSGRSDVPVDVLMDGFNPGDSGVYRLSATNGGGTTPSSFQNFSTLAILPTATTGTSSNVALHSITLHGTVNPGGASTSYRFLYWVNSRFKFASDWTPVGSGNSNIEVSANISGLLSDQTYDYQIVATNSVGTVEGLTDTFHTSAIQYTAPGINGIDQTLQKIYTTKTNTIFGNNFIPETTVSMFLDGGNERDILATLNLPIISTASTVAANRLWLNSSTNGLGYYSLQQDPATPVLEGTVNLGGQVTALTSDETYVYAAYYTGSSHVVQRINSTTGDPVAGTVTLDSKALDMEMGPGFLWVLTENRIVKIDPVNLGSHSFAHGFDVVNNIPYAKALAVTDSNIFVLGWSSVTTTAMRVFLYNGSQIDDFPSAYTLRNLTFSNNYDTGLVATTDDIIVMDFSQYPDSGPTVLSELPLDIGPCTLRIRDDLCYAAGDYGLEILNISDPGNPQKIGYTYTPATCSLALFEDVAYLPNSENAALTVVDVATPSRFQAIGMLEIEPRLCCPELLNGRYFVFDRTDIFHSLLFGVATGKYTTDDDKLYDVNVSDPEKPVYDAESVTITCPDNFRDIACSPLENYLALAYGPSGIYIQFYNSGQQYSGWYNTGLADVQHTLADPNDGTKLWVADINGIFQLNVTRAAPAVTQINSYQDIDKISRILKVTDEYIYAARNHSQEIVRILRSNGTYVIWDMTRESYNVWKTVITNDDKLIIGYKPYSQQSYTQSISLYIYDISGDDLDLQSISEYAYPYMTSLSIQREDLIFITSRMGLTTIDISDSEHPLVLGTQKSPSTVVQAERRDIGDEVYTFGKFGFVIMPLPQKIATTYVSPTELQGEIPSPKLDGNYTFRVHNGSKFTDLPGAITFTDVNRLLTSKAIIVAGRKADDLVWTETRAYADQAYENLRFQGYAPGDIVYLTADGVGADVDGVATNASLQTAIAAITNGADPNKKDLLLYLVDHGGPGTFQLNEGEFLDALDLDEWLDALQNSASADNQVVVAYDACKSASFLRYLKPPADKNRIVMTSSDADQSAYFLNSSHSFSAHLWSSFSGRTGETVNLSNGFWQAADMMVEYQVAQLDADGDGLPNEPEDETALAALEEGHLYAVRRGYSYRRAERPIIGEIAADQTINGTSTATLSVSGVYDADGIGSVFAVIIPPDFVADPDLTVTDQLGSVELNPDGLGGYDISHPGFNDQGTYIITYYAVDSNGIYSLPATSLVMRTDGTNPSLPDAYEDDDSSAVAAAAPKVILPNDLHSQFHTFHDVNDEDWAIFYAAAGIHNVRVDNVSAICNPQIEIIAADGTTLMQTINAAGMGQDELGTWNCPVEGIYYLRLTNLSGHWGANVSYSLRLYNPGAFSYDGYVSGVVTDDQAAGLVGATLSAGGGTSLSQPDGSYVMGLFAGSYTVDVTKESYVPDSFGVTITAGNDQVKNVQLTKPNAAPSVSLTDVISSLPENTSTPVKIADIVVTDDGQGTNNLTLSGADAGSFAIVGTELRLTAILDYESKTFYAVTVAVDDPSVGGTPDDTASTSLTVTDVNEAPAITQTGPLTATMSEDGSPTAWVAPDVDADDPDTGDTLTWTLASGPSHGSATVSGTGASPTTFTYSPAANYNGSDSFVIRVSDGLGGTDTITVNVTVESVNDAPSAVIDSPPISVDEDAAGTPLSANGSSDVDGDPITYLWEVLSGSVGTVLYGSDTAAPTFDPPNVGPGGGDITFQLTVDDGDLTAIAQCTITINWVPYVVAECYPLAVNERQPVGISVTGDPDATIDTITVEQTGGLPAENWDSVNLTFTAPNLDWTSPPADMDFNVTVEYLEGPSASAEDICTVTVHDIPEDFDHDEDIDGADLADFIFRYEHGTLPAVVDLSTFAEELGQ